MLSDHHNFFKIDQEAGRHPHVWSRGFHMFLGDMQRKDHEIDKLLKTFYEFINSKLQIRMLNSTHYDRGFETEEKFMIYNFNQDFAGTISFDFEIKYLWFNNISNEFYEIFIPAGFFASLSVVTDGSIVFYLHFKGNVFTNTLWGDDGTEEGYSYHFRPAAVYNRAFVRNMAMEMERRFGGILESYPDKDLFTKCDKYGPTDDSLLRWLDPDYKQPN